MYLNKQNKKPRDKISLNTNFLDIVVYLENILNDIHLILKQDLPLNTKKKLINENKKKEVSI